MLTVAYDGTNYCGWQIQNNADTIEAHLNQCLSDLLQEDIKISGASRTDTGVHALMNLAVFDTTHRIEAGKIAGALNVRLPMDIRIKQSIEVEEDYHPRFVSTRKSYQYRIYMGQYENPIGRNYAHFVYVPLDIEAMQKACQYFIGEHDFKSFCSARAQVKTTVRTIYKAEIIKEGEYLLFNVTGNGFLFHMVRIIVGTLIKVGRGKIAPEQIPTILEACNRSAAGPTAPSRGLTLMKYEFLDEIN